MTEPTNYALSAACQQLFGETAAVTGAVLALIETHPNPELLLVTMVAGLERMHAMFLAESQSESGLNHFQAQTECLLTTCRRALEAQRLRRQP